jgi:ceramide glucosyltransferase
VSNDYLSKKVALLKPGVGVVTAAVAGVNPEGWGARLEATYLNTFYTRGMNLAFATGNPCVVGKSMLFRRSDASRFGGIRALGDYLAEDYALGEQMRKLGLSVELMDSPIEQYIGQYSFRSFWDRHLRWGRIRKVHAPGAFLIEPLFSPLISSIAAGIALHGILGFILAASFWGACDFLLMRKMLNRNRDLWWIPLAWVLREFLALPLWMAVASGNSVQWRGSTLFLSYGGKIHGGVKEWSTEPSSGVLLPAHTKLRGTTKVVTGGLGKPRVILREG